jgi:ActR/RegA family two-component response regulator
MLDKVLFVDDEPPVLDGYRRMLRREFAVNTAVGGEEGLALIRAQGPFAVVVSDMRMPGMNGGQFLAHLRQESPETVRMLLTGYTDVGAAMDAVNEGNIFRFLTKPCEKDVITKALVDGLVQHRLILAEKNLLEKTLMGTIKVLTEVLSIVSPEAFGRSTRVARYVRELVSRFDLPFPWRFEAAAMLSQLGCVTLLPELIRSAYMGEPLSPENQARFDAHPQVARELLIHIPRLEQVAWMISQQFTCKAANDAVHEPVAYSKDVLLGAEILKLALAFDNLHMKGMTEINAMAELRLRKNEYARELIDALEEIESDSAHMELRTVHASKLETGMVLQQEIRTRTGMLVAPKGQEITNALLLRLENFSRTEAIDSEIAVLIPA